MARTPAGAATRTSAKPELMSAQEAGELEEADLGEAFRLTEEEIFAESNSEAEPDNSGDRSLERMEDIEGNPVDDAGDETGEDEEAENEQPDAQTEEEGEPGDEEEREPAQTRQEQQPRPGVPPHRLREERQARKTVEQQLAEERAARLRLEGQVETLTRLGTRPQGQEQPERPTKPDMFADPEGWERATRAELAEQFRAQQVNAAMADAHEDYGEEFEEAFQAINALDPRNPDHVRQVQSIYQAPNPGRALMRWHKNQQTAQALQEHGGDLQAYIDAEVERRLNGGGEQPSRGERGGQQQRQAGQQRQSRVTFTPGARDQAGARRVPPSLNAASGAGSHRPAVDPRGVDGSEGAIFDYVFDNRTQSVR